MATISTLLPYLYGRVDELDESGPIWVTENEAASALSEAFCDLMLLVGRPDLIVSQPFLIQPNQYVQQVPEGIFAITNLQGPASEIWKVTLEDLDYAQVAGPDWEQDIGTHITTWAPLGFTKFLVHPAVAEEQYVLLTGIASPVVGTWPPSGTTPVPFHDEFFQAIEKYAAVYLRFKESGSDFAESMDDYKSYLADARRMSTIEDRRDQFIFQGATGSTIIANPTKLR